jgi:hypothetical protein
MRYVVCILLAFSMLGISGCQSTSEIDRSEIRIKLRFVCDEFDDLFYYPTPLMERKDLLTVLAELSLKENPAIRFISTNQTEEIMEVNGRRTSWKEAWEIYLNGQKITPYDLKKGIRVGDKDKIEIKLEPTERVFGTPTKHGDSVD